MNLCSWSVAWCRHAHLCRCVCSGSRLRQLMLSAFLPFPTPILELWQASSHITKVPHSLHWLNLESHLSLGPSKLLDGGTWCFTLKHSPRKKSGQLWSSKCKGRRKTFVFSMPWNKLSSKVFLREMLLIAFKPHEKTQMDDDGIL